MRNYLALMALPLLALTACEQAGTEAEPTEQGAEAEANAALDAVLAADLRADDKARDEYRNPAETLAFFGVEADDTVIEYAPGGGWYTRILAPYVTENGSYVAVGFAPEAAESLGEDFMARVREGGETFAAKQSESLGIDAEKLPFHFGNAIPADLNGQVDRVLIFRMMHNLMRWGIADGEIEALKATLKPDGMIGIVQHRAKADAPADYADGNKGYLKQADLVAFMEKHGFELAAESEVNANPNDTADYEKGVWTLPPSYAEGEESKKKYDAIGESDRMTLLFKLADAGDGETES
ncbi:class I SAM-dependent methyltransferase [Alterisphingorhabdus coralli]|uniref:Methyltransferase n=1 Tax=Alterisphingorhabdus coralli TaxID=3071408 RepID=A0AA97F7W4_9SPHN|nr:methyltransferase [Parasphingorhabdus sp. SCSIO 66989]WOE76034.1 methyltransferase [Parasphingorhabdus sp. SCSIO 66989]